MKLSTTIIDLNCFSLIKIKKSKFKKKKTDCLQCELFLGCNSPRFDQNQPCYCCSSIKNSHSSIVSKKFHSGILSMEVEVGLAHFIVYKDFVSCFLYVYFR